MSRPSSPARLLLLSACSLALVLSNRPALALLGPHAHKEAKEQINDLEQQWRTATLTGDAAAMDRLLSDDYVGISWTGQVNTKTTQLDHIRNKTIVLTQMELSDIKIKLLGQVAIVTSSAEVVGTNDGLPMLGTFRYTRVYQHLPSGFWKITSFEATRVPKHLRGRAQPSPDTP